MTRTNHTDRDAYVRTVIDLYRKHPHTTGRARKADRRLAQSLFELRVAITTIEQAMALAEARRPSTHMPVEQIQSLHYFFNTIREIHFHPIENDYYQYLKRRRLHQRS